MNGAEVTITADEAADIARSIRDDVSQCYRQGMLTAFVCGMYQGHLTMIRVYMKPEEWILQGIENEINFYCRRAQQKERTLP